MSILVISLAIFCAVPSLYASAAGQSAPPAVPSSSAQNPSAATASESHSPAPKVDGSPATPQNSTASDSKDNKKDTSDRDHRLHVRLGTVFVGAGYSHFSGPFYGDYYGYAPYGFYPYGPYDRAFASFYWAPFGEEYGVLFHPAFWQGYAYSDGKGEVRLSSSAKMADVFIDGAYAGPADHLKSMWLEPGAYDLTVSAKDGSGSFSKRIYVLSGKSLKISAKLTAGHPPEKSEEKP